MVPLQPRIKKYSGSNERQRQKVNEQNSLHLTIVDYINGLVANDPEELQQYFFGDIALDLGVSVDRVMDAIKNGGVRGITVRVRQEDRPALARYKNLASG
jgi:hypothetical protein